MSKSRLLSCFFLGLSVFSALSGCSGAGGGGSTQAPLPISVSVSPGSATLIGGATQNFTASVSNDSANAGVTWAVSVGSVTQAGVYTAPSPVTATSAIVSATSKSDPSKSGMASITLTPVAIALTSASAINLTGDGIQTTTIGVSVTGDGSAAGATFVVSGASGTMSASRVSGNSPTSIYTTPVVSTATSSTITVASVADPTKTQTVMVTLSPSSPMSFTTPAGALTAGNAGGVYPSTTIAVAGGSGTKTFTVTSGSLPAGLTMSASGVISGTPTGPLITSNFTVQVTDQTGASNAISRSFSIVIAAPQLLSVSPSSVTLGVTGTTVTLTGSGFGPVSTIYIAGSAIQTTYISPQSLSFLFPAQNYTGSYSLMVRNLSYNSNSITFPVVNAAPTLTSISPATVIAGSPNFPLTVTGTGFTMNSTVMVNGVSYAISNTNGTTASIIVAATQVASVGSLPVTVVTPTPGGGTSAVLQLQMVSADNRLRTLNYQALDIVTDPVRNLLYASIGSNSTTNPNSIVAIDPLQGTVVTTQAMPVQPGQLAITDDGSYLYVSLPSAGQVSRLLLPSLKPDIQWTLGYTAEDIETAPGAPHTIAATGVPTGYTNSVAIWDDGVERPLVPTTGYPSPSYDTVAWGPDATTLYGTMAVTSGGPEYILSVGANGLTVSNTLTSVFGSFVKRLTFNKTTGDLYDGFGDVVDAPTGHHMGVFNIQNTYGVNPFAIDPVRGKAFFFDSNYTSPNPGNGSLGPDIQAFNLSTFSNINDLYIPGMIGSKIVQWGTSGLAVGGGNQIYILDGSFVSPSGIASQIGSYVAETPTLTSISPQTVQAGSVDTTLTLTGLNFNPAVAATWNSQALSITWLSSTQATVTIPAALLTQAVSAPVLLSNGPGTESAIGPAFTVLPDLGPNTLITAMDVSGEDMVWDPTRSLLYVAVTNSAASNGNSIAAVDPAAATIQNVVYTGNQPASLGISDDGVYLYAGFQTLTSVKRFKLSDFSLNLTIPLTSSVANENYAADVKVAPGQNQTVAVSMGNKNIEPRDAGGLVIYDNAVQRPKALAYAGLGDTFKLTWGKDATRIFGQSDPEITPQSSTIITVDSTGITGRTGDGGGLGYINLRPHYDSGVNLVYSDGGQIINPTDGTPAGVFESFGMMVPDSTLNRAYFLRANNNSSGYGIDIYELSTQTLIKTIPVGNLSGYPTQFVRWGSQGLAFLTDSQGAPSGTLYILQGSDISGVSSAPPGAITLNPARVVEGAATGATITVTGTNFVPASTVLVNGTTRKTTFISSTQVSFQLTSADQGSANYLSVAVTNSGTAGTTSPASSLEVDNPVPVISSLSSAIVPANSGSMTIAVFGSGFVPGTTVLFSSSARPTTVVSPTQVTVALTYTDVATAGKFAIAVLTPGPGGGTSAAATFEVDNPAPLITGLSPSTLPTGSSAQNISVFGSGFVPSTVIQVGGTARTTLVNTPSQLSVQLTAADLATSGSVSLVAVTPGPGGGSSSAASVAVNNGIPGPITLNPSTVLQGATTPATITVNGSNFMQGSTVQVSGSNRTTTYVSSTQLTFQLTVADQATVGSRAVTVVNPSPGGTSPVTSLTIAAPTATPVISSVFPTQLVIGSGATSLQIVGTGFTSGSVVSWNGTALGSSYFGSELLAQVPASLLLSTGTASITVSNATASPSLSNAVSLSIVQPPAPTLTSISPLFGPINTAFVETLTGTGFTASSVVSVNGNVLPTTFVGATQLTAAVPANQLLPGNSSFTVTTPAPGGGVSSGVVFTAYVAVANNSMIYNPTNGLFYLSVPSSAGAPYGNSIVSLDPVTGALGNPIFVGSEPNRLALTSDGRYLWVGLDGAQAVRKVDLIAKAAGLQFSIPTYNSGFGIYPLTADALVAVPGQTDSVVVSSGDGQGPYSTLAIYDSGVVRGSILALFTDGIVSLQIDGTRSELYTAGNSFANYITYTYSSAGLVLKTSVTSAGALASYIEDRIQLASGRVYTDYNTIYDAESGALLGNFSTTLAPNGYEYSTPVAIDSTLGLAFMLNTPVQYSSVPNQIQVFNLSNFTQAGTAVIPVNVATNVYGELVAPLSRLTRWGADGLAFRSNVSVYSLRSNLVQNLSASTADLGVTLTPSGGSVTGTQTTYTATISNAGPSAASEVALTAVPPSTGVLVSATPSSGTCSIVPSISCDLGTMSSGATATVRFVVNQMTPGTASMTVQISASQPDPNLANNQATSTSNITGTTYSVVPTLQSISPVAILAGSTDTVITLTGTGFGPGTTIQMDGATLQTSLVSATQLTATVPAASLAMLGWHQLAVSNPTPGGGISAALPLSIYSVIKAGVNHIVYEPFSRQIYATLGSAVQSGNSVEALTPAAGTFSTPVFVGSQPTTMSLSDDGQILYVFATGSNRLVRYNVLTQQPEFSYDVNSTNVGFAVQTGSENTLAVTGASTGISILDFNPATHTAAVRPSVSTGASSIGVQFLDASDLIVGGTNGLQFSRYAVSSTGVGSTPSSYAPGESGLFKLANGFAFTGNGNVVDVTSQPGRLVGNMPAFNPSSAVNPLDAMAPDPAIGRVFFLSGYDQPNYSSGIDGIAAFDSNTFLPAAFVPLNFAAIEPNGPYTVVDVIRWGQDGVAALMSSGNIYLVRGPAVLPQLLQASAAPVLTSASATILQHGSGNTVLTLTGSNFLPGVAASWNGSYRTTNFVSGTQITVDIPAADLASPGTSSITAANPGSASSPGISIAVN